MKGLITPEKSEGLGLLFARVPLGVCFAVVGTTVIARPGVAAFAGKYASLLPHWVARDVGRGVLMALPFVAALAGAMIVVGVFTRLNGFIASAILLGLIALSSGVRDTKGVLPFHPNLVLLVAGEEVHHAVHSLDRVGGVQGREDEVPRLARGD